MTRLPLIALAAALAAPVAVAALSGSPSQSQPPAPALSTPPPLASDAEDATACTALAGRDFGGAHVASADFMPADSRFDTGQKRFFSTDTITVHTSKAFCRVRGVIEQTIRFELWLPRKAAWNGKLLGAGVGGDAGRFNYDDLPRGVDRGYAAATTDTGHSASDVAWMMKGAAILANYTHRANHLLAVDAKEIIGDYYGAAPRRSYFIGCSGGGRQGLKEMQLYPADYDGVISGDDGPDTAEMTTRRMWELKLRDDHPGLMSPADWKLISDAGIKACDGQDGLVDGVSENPLQCRFDLSTLLCNGSKRDGQCLTAKQVTFAKQFYAPLVDENGQKLDDGILPGVLIDSGRSQLALGTFGRAIRHDPNWQGQGFDLARDYAAVNRVMPQLRANQADLSAFAKRGGKAILYTGWMDPAVAARMVISYRDRVVAAAGGQQQADRFFRLYMVPGMYHCAGGPATDQFGGAGGDAPIVDPRHDLLSALDAWVDKGIAPQSIIASKKRDGQVVRTRPLCPYPQQAHYVGHGSIDDAANFTCKAPDGGA